jgi:signal transduction histidine kinase
VSRIETGSIELRLAPVDLAELIEASLAEVRPLAGQKGLSLEFTHEDVASGFVGDAHRIRAILLNLLSNAVKFTPAGGRITVAVARNRDTIRISVSDTGIGIPQDEQERIFEKFHRISGPELTGNGLGLSIAREFARLHGGDLVLASTVGLGSRFTVILPVTQTRPVATPPVPARA